ncbi:MAG: aminotransferase class I/II-fold pyridoxal phosphate-dependent enzyme [Oscillospiraceae bacterium]|nr:aminotransferase class I/II-fold pyridoxal phosphate-dependent enzyme [Oscillospiraceae bacterium]
MEKLALLGGKPAIENPPEKHLFGWPILTEEDEAAALQVIRDNSFSGTDITEKFQDEFAAWQGRKYALAYCNGTLSLTAAMFAIGLSMGDEIICPTKTYWASVTQAQNFGAAPVFCNVDENLSMDPADLERCVSDRTKAIMVVHYSAYPCDMDPIMAIAEKYGLYVIEDVSHAQGGLYKGRKLGNFGHVAAMSLMSGKSFAAGELGILVTDDRRIYERAIAFAHYERNNEKYITESEDLKPYAHIALGGVKGRANQLCSALARGQLKHYDERCAEIRKAMNYFWDLLEGVPGIRAIRVDESTGSNMAGWYNPLGRYIPEELGGLSAGRFCEALRAEGVQSWDGGNYCLHTHALFKTMDLYGAGKPSRVAFTDHDVREDDAKCDPSTRLYCFSVPWFKHFDREWIEKYAAAIRKVAENYGQLLEDDAAKTGGRWYGLTN